MDGLVRVQMEAILVVASMEVALFAACPIVALLPARTNQTLWIALPFVVSLMPGAQINQAAAPLARGAGVVIVTGALFTLASARDAPWFVGGLMMLVGVLALVLLEIALRASGRALFTRAPPGRPTVGLASASLCLTCSSLVAAGGLITIWT